MTADIERVRRRDEAVLCAFSEAGRQWMLSRYPGRVNPDYDVLIFELPAQQQEMEDCVSEAANCGLSLRDLLN